MPEARRQREHYDLLVRTRRPTRWGVSCGFDDRFDPALLEGRPTLRRAVEALFDRILPHHVGTVLDLGCGTGWYWPLLRERCSRLVGLEGSLEMASCGVRYRRKTEQGGPSVFVGEARTLPFRAESFDLVLAVDVLHHVQDLQAVTAEVRRVLRPGGRLVAIEPNVLNPVVFLAHLIPPEERGALWPNHPRATSKALQRELSLVDVIPVTYVSGIRNEAALRLVARLEPLFERPPLSLWSLRRVLIARKP